MLQATRHAWVRGVEGRGSDAKYRLPALGVADQEGPRLKQRRVGLFDHAAIAEQATPQFLQSRLASQVERCREQAAVVGGGNEHGALRAAEHPAAIGLRLAVHVQHPPIEIDLPLRVLARQVQVAQACRCGSLECLHNHLCA